MNKITRGFDWKCMMLTCCKSDLLGADKLHAKRSFKVFQGLVFEGNDDMTDVVIGECECQKMAVLDPSLCFLQIFLKLTQIKFDA